MPSREQMTGVVILGRLCQIVVDISCEEMSSLQKCKPIRVHAMSKVSEFLRYYCHSRTITVTITKNYYLVFSIQ